MIWDGGFGQERVGMQRLVVQLVGQAHLDLLSQLVVKKILFLMLFAYTGRRNGRQRAGSGQDYSRWSNCLNSVKPGIRII